MQSESIDLTHFNTQAQISTILSDFWRAVESDTACVQIAQFPCDLKENLLSVQVGIHSSLGEKK